MFFSSDKTWVFDQSERAQGPIYILKINMLTTYMIVNFNKMLEMLPFQQSYAQYLYSIQIYKQIIKSVLSSSEHYF